MARKRANLSDLLNDLTFRTLYNKYKLLAVSEYEWENLPEGIESKHIEKLLFSFGKAVFFRASGMGFMCLEAQEGGKYNVNHEPLYWNAVGFGFNERLKADDCVIIDNNLLRLSTKDIVLFYVNKLTEAERTMDVNVKAVKTPTIFACDDKDVLTFKRLFQQVDGNVPAIFADRGINLDSIQAYKTDVKFLCNDLMDYKKSVENELFTFLGFNNLAVDKKERVNVEEAESNNELIESFSDMQLRARKLACERINELFGLNIRVKKNQKEVKADGKDDNVRRNGDDRND